MIRPPAPAGVCFIDRDIDQVGVIDPPPPPAPTRAGVIDAARLWRARF